MIVLRPEIDEARAQELVAWVEAQDPSLDEIDAAARQQHAMAAFAR